MHAEAETQALPAVLSHPMVPAGTPELIQSSDDLAALVAALRAGGSFAFDTEFIGEQTFYPRICLVQVATSDRLTLIDPLASEGGQALDLRPFWDLITDPAVAKTVHAGQQDLEPALRLTGLPPANVFDTQIAAALIGEAYPISLGKLALALVGADVGFGAKFSQWDARPLTPVQLQYAANDVRYLPVMRVELDRRIAELGHQGACAEEMAAFCDPRQYRVDPRDQKIKARGVGALSPSKRAVLEDLVDWRFDLARRVNLPLRSLLPDEGLVNLAVARPASVEAFCQVKSVPRPVKQQYAQVLVDRIAAARAQPRSSAPRPRLTDFEAHRQQVEVLWGRIAAAAEARSIQPAIVTSKKELGRLVAARMLGEAMPATRLSRGWRAELLGATLAEELFSPQTPEPPTAA